MAKTIRILNTTITVTSGAGSLSITTDVFRVISDAGGFLRQVLVKAPHEKDEFSFNITDDDDFIVFDVDGAVTKINDITEIPLRGDCDLNITNATRDGTYNVKLIFFEVW